MMPAWFAEFLLSPSILAAVAVAIRETPHLDGVNTTKAAVWVATTPYGSRRNAAALWAQEHPLHGLMWEFLALRAGDDDLLGAVIAATEIEDAPPEVTAALQVWRMIATGEWTGVGNDVFAAVHRALKSNKETPMFQFPMTVGGAAAFDLLSFSRWDVAARWLRSKTMDNMPDPAPLDLLLPASALREGADRWETRKSMSSLVDHLFALGTPQTGELALCWLMLCCDPKVPTLFSRCVPQLQHLLDQAASNVSADERADLQHRLDVWWQCARGDHVGSEYSALTLAVLVEPGDLSASEMEHLFVDTPAKPLPQAPLWMRNRPKTATPTPPNTVRIVVGEPAAPLPPPWKEMSEARLPLVVAQDVAGVRARLHAEYPHARKVIDGLMRDLRDDKPARLQNVILLGPAGVGKSRLVRRLSEELSLAAGRRLYVGRFDCSGSHDGMFSGSPRAWSNSQASVPALAVLSGQIANPIMLLDELEKSGSGTHNGRLWDSLLPFLDVETSARYPESGLGNVALDLSSVSYIATANSVTDLPTPLRDRFRILTVPQPTLEHLPALAAVVMRDIAKQDDERLHDAPLADDELAIIGRVWRQEKFSMRKLQRIVSTTLEVRDSMARRH